MTLSEYDVRKLKAVQLKEIGINPYASSFQKKDTISSLLQYGKDSFPDVEEIISQPIKKFSTAGRITLYRTHGKLSFGKLLDETGEIQLMWHTNNCRLTGVDADKVAASGLSAYKILEKYIDVGDFIGVHGDLFHTHKGELTLFVSQWQLLSKAIRPLGDKFHGIGEDQETAYRKRYLDMIFNNSTLERMKFRSHFIRALREFYRSHDFLEIDCPVLTPAASGAAAKPFVTHHNDFDKEFYLRICNETELKKATIGGLEKVFTIATNFRNEGSDPSHLQEFCMLEHQSVYKSFHEDMTFTEKMFDYIFDTLNIARRIVVKDKLGNPKEVDFTTPWPKLDYVEGVNQASGLDITSYTIEDADKLRSDIKAKGIEFDGMETMGTMTLIDYLYKKVLRPTLTGPVFLYNYPSIIAPLARISDTDPNKCEKWQVVVNGREIINSYGELVDPVRQLENFHEQSKASDEGDAEATTADYNYVEAMEYGMPIQAGFGMGIDRIIALITQQDNLRDVVMFPLMKPLNNEKGQNDTAGTRDEEIGENTSTKSKGHNYNDNLSIPTPPLPTIDQAESLAQTYLKDTLRHCQQVGKVMKYFANKLGQDETYWYIVGLLHDVDRDHVGKMGDKHLKEEFDIIIDSINLEDASQLKQDIRSHGPYLTGVEPTTLLQKYLISIDELSGLIYAYSLMRPEGFENIEWSSLNKKIKDKKFAAGVDREHVKNCETYLNIPLAEFAMEVVSAMK